MNIIERARAIVSIERDALTDAAANIDGNFAAAVELILACKGRVVITGMGKSGHIGQKIAATMASVGTPAFFVHPAEAIHGDLGMIQRDDVVLALSYSGKTEEIVRLIPIIKRFGMKLVAMCGRKESPLVKEADVWLNTSVKAEACPWDVVPTSSTTAMLALGDALALVLMEKRKFQIEDFAKFHPGGALGRGLLRVEDVMRAGAELPVVPPSAGMKTVLKEMSDKTFGVALIRTPDGALAGIITDGDIRRLIQTVDDPMAGTAGELMHKNPKTIGRDAVGGAAVKVMEDNKITALAVTDANGKLEGLVRLHDLLRAGVV